MKEISGLKVIELAGVLAGPSVGMFFAELGAEVIKVEPAKTGDVTRHWRVPGEDKNKAVSAYYASINWGKQVIFKNLHNANDLEFVQKLCKEADVVIANFNQDRCEKFQLGYEAIKMDNPGVIYASLTGFGKEDPRPAFDVVLQAEAGFLFMCGESGGNPVKMPVALIDVLAAHHLKEGILLGLLKKEKTGKGSNVEVSLYKAAISSLVNQASNYLNAGFIPQKMGCQHPNIAPYGDFFTTADNKQLVLAVGSDKQFAKLATILDFTSDMLVSFASNQQRVEKRKILIEVIEKKLRTMDANGLEAALSKENIPYGMIKNMKDVFENPVAKAMILQEEHEDGSISKRVSGIAFSMSDDTT